jgi:hypothetical protein
VTAVASQVMMLDGRLAEAEETLQQTASYRSAAAAVARRSQDQPATAGRAKAGSNWLDRRRAARRPVASTGSGARL